MHIHFFLSSDNMESEQLYFRDDTALPIYSTRSSSYSASDLCDILLSDDLNACRLQPLGVTDNASFVIDLDSVQFEDLKADDLGVWKSTGVKRSDFIITSKGETRFQVGRSRGSAHYTLLRRYYVHGTCPSFHRLIVSIEGELVILLLLHNIMHVHLTQYNNIILALSLGLFVLHV